MSLKNETSLTTKVWRNDEFNIIFNLLLTLCVYYFVRLLLFLLLFSLAALLDKLNITAGVVTMVLDKPVINRNVEDR